MSLLPPAVILSAQAERKFSEEGRMVAAGIRYAMTHVCDNIKRNVLNTARVLHVKTEASGACPYCVLAT